MSKFSIRSIKGTQDILPDQSSQWQSLEEAIRKMTSLPADSAGLSKRGRIAPGMTADLVILDPKKLSDKSTDEKPNAYPSGVETVIVNGGVVLNHGQRTNDLPGKLAKL